MTTYLLADTNTKNRYPDLAWTRKNFNAQGKPWCYWIADGDIISGNTADANKDFVHPSLGEWLVDQKPATVLMSEEFRELLRKSVPEGVVLELARKPVQFLFTRTIHNDVHGRLAEQAKAKFDPTAGMFPTMITIPAHGHEHEPAEYRLKTQAIKQERIDRDNEAGRLHTYAMGKATRKAREDALAGKKEAKARTAFLAAQREANMALSEAHNASKLWEREAFAAAAAEFGITGSRNFMRDVNDTAMRR